MSVTGEEKSEAIKGTRSIAQRIVSAEENFIGLICEKGFTRTEAAKAMNTMLRLKVAKLDAVIGRISMKHGAFWEVDSIRRAVEFK